ncbi:hypothetical protein AKO1_013492 [Acrasis kona]|uniref:Uncharacterized protein n=1 Tax=Acrasis kona TaxID=1008807 RepID=A0AAW2YNL5_9EUKA
MNESHTVIRPLRARAILLLLLLYIHYSHCQDTTTTSNNIGRGVAPIRQSVKRTTFSTKSLPIQFDPSNGEYWESMGVLAMLGACLIVLSFVLMVMLPILTGFRLLGGAEPMVGFHRGRDRKKPYPSSHRTILLLLFVITFVLVTGVIGLCYTVNSVLMDDFEMARISVKSSQARLYKNTLEMYLVFLKLDVILNVTTSPELQTILNVMASLTSAQQEAMNNTLVRDVGRVNKVRSNVLYFVLAVMLLPSILGILGGSLVMHDCASVARTISWYSVLICWIVFTIHLPAASIGSDLCKEMNDYMAYGNSTNKITVPTSNNNDFISQIGNGVQSVVVGYLDVVSHCARNKTFIPGIGLDQSIVSGQLLYINQLLRNADSDRTWYNFDISNVSNAMYLPILTNNTVLRDNIKYNIQLTFFMQQSVDNVTIYNNCTHVESAYQQVQSSFCVNCINAMDSIWFLFFILGCLNTIVVVICNLAYKRFRRKKYVVPRLKSNFRMGGVYVRINHKLL